MTIVEVKQSVKYFLFSQERGNDIVLRHEYNGAGQHRLRIQTKEGDYLGDWVSYSQRATLVYEDREFEATTDYERERAFEVAPLKRAP